MGSAQVVICTFTRSASCKLSEWHTTFFLRTVQSAGRGRAEYLQIAVSFAATPCDFNVLTCTSFACSASYVIRMAQRFLPLGQRQGVRGEGRVFACNNAPIFG